jgi:large subunit ribosomal protein L21
MYAVVVSGGKQHKVAPGDVLRVEKLDAPAGETVELGPVQLLSSESGIVTDPETLSSAKVLAVVKAHGRAKKIRVFKMKRRKNYSRTQGHRQSYTEIQIRDIQS